MKKAVNQWCFPETTPLNAMIEETAKAGFWGLELNLNEPGQVGLTMETTPSEVKQIRRQMLDAGVQPSCVSTALLWKAPLTAENAEVRAQGHNVVVKQIELAAALKVDTILVVPGVVRAPDNYDACYERSQEELSVLADEAQRAGVKIGIENVWNKFLLSPHEMKSFVDEVNHPSLGVYFDVGNVLLYGFPHQWIQSLGTRIFKAHVKDFLPAVGNGNGFVPLLSGSVDWPQVMQAFKTIGYDDVLTAEISPYPLSPYQAVYDTSRQMDEILRM